MRRKPLNVLVYLPTHVKPNHDLLLGVLQHAERAGLWEISVIGVSEKYDQVDLEDLSRYHGAICYADGSEIAERVRKLTIPVVAVFPDQSALSDPPAGPRTAVFCDSAPVGRAAAAFYLARTPGSFVYVQTDPPRTWSVQRRDSFIAEVRRQGGEVAVVAVKTAAADTTALQKTLKGLPRPVAVFAENDWMSRTVIAACRKAGLSVPRDVWVLGVNNDELLCGTANPPLSSIRMDAVASGRRAAQALHAMMRGHKSAKTPITYTYNECVERLSTATEVKRGALAEGATRVIEEHMTHDLNAKALLVGDIVKELGVSRRTLEIDFRRRTGRSLHDEIVRIQLKKAKTLLLTTTASIDDISSRCGFSSPSHFGATFRKLFGHTPSEARRYRDQ